MRRILGKLIIALVLIIGVPCGENIANEPIKIVIDQESLILKQPPILEGGSIFLPLKTIFEALDIKVGWDAKTQTVTGVKENTIIKLEVGKRQASINNKKVLMDVECKMINNNVMVPAGFVAENLDVDIEWDNYNQIITIKSGFASYKNSNFKDDYTEIIANEEGTLSVRGKTLSDNQYILLEIIDFSGREVFNGQGEIEEDGTFNQLYSVALDNGQYIINIFMNDKQYGTYTGIDTGIIIRKSKDKIVFGKSPVYRNNMEYLRKSNKVSSSDLNMHSFTEINKEILYKLATDITKGESTDYYKALAVASWVSENIYYDVDAAKSGQFRKTDAIGTLNEKRSVCQGYAALTTGLLRSIGIPTKLVFGYALGIETDINSWDQVGDVGPNHVWNEVFVDNRWIIVDTTWNSKNRYEEGEYIDNDKIYAYFDPTVEAFSNTHKITNR